MRLSSIACAPCAPRARATATSFCGWWRRERSLGFWPTGSIMLGVLAVRLGRGGEIELPLRGRALRAWRRIVLNPFDALRPDSRAALGFELL
jgi:hypothetical protein